MRAFAREDGTFSSPRLKAMRNSIINRDKRKIAGGKKVRVQKVLREDNPVSFDVFLVTHRHQIGVIRLIWSIAKKEFSWQSAVIGGCG